MAEAIMFFEAGFSPARLARRVLMSGGRILCAAACSAAVLFAGAAFGQGRYSEIGKRVSRAVVKLETFDNEGQPKELGAGFLVGSNGLIVTNYHVIRGAFEVKATCASGDAYRVQGVVDFDPEKDFAILKVTGFDLPVVELGNSNQIEILEDVITIGHPEGLEFSSSLGNVSARRAKNDFTMLQITAPISPGNSGGPLINSKGQVIGIVTEQMTEGQNLNFALPINYVRAALESNTRVRFTLRQIAEAQAKRDEERMAELLATLFTVYEDKYKVYKAVVPKTWKVANSEHWTEDRGQYDIVTMMVPESAARAEVDGYLSEGIRVHVSMPPGGKVWTLGTAAEYATAFSKGVLSANQGFVQTSVSNDKVGQESIKVFEFVGQNSNITEPEKDRFYVIAKPECRIIVECVSPAAKFKDEEMLFRIFMRSFEFKACPGWKK